MPTQRIDELLDGMQAALSEERADMDLTGVMDAARFAAEARVSRCVSVKCGCEDHMQHSIEVAILVARAGLGPTAVVSAVLHDVLQGTGVTYKLVRERFGPDVAGIVCELSGSVQDALGDPDAGSRMDRADLSGMSSIAKSIRCADTVGKVRLMVSRDPSSARMYLAEKRDQLNGLLSANKVLLTMAVSAVERASLELDY